MKFPVRLVRGRKVEENVGLECRLVQHLAFFVQRQVSLPGLLDPLFAVLEDRNPLLGIHLGVCIDRYLEPPPLPFSRNHFFQPSRRRCHGGKLRVAYASLKRFDAFTR